MEAKDVEMPPMPEGVEKWLEQQKIRIFGDPVAIFNKDRTITTYYRYPPKDNDWPNVKGGFFQ